MRLVSHAWEKLGKVASAVPRQGRKWDIPTQLTSAELLQVVASLGVLVPVHGLHCHSKLLPVVQLGRPGVGKASTASRQDASKPKNRQGEVFVLYKGTLTERRLPVGTRAKSLPRLSGSTKIHCFKDSLVMYCFTKHTMSPPLGGKPRQPLSTVMPPGRSAGQR